MPNIGAIASGILMVAVGFSASANQGLWAIVVYFFVHNFEGYVVLPYVARRTVDLAPAVLLAMQLLMGALFGILGVLFADPLLAMLKVILVDLSHREAEREGESPALVGDSLTAASPAAVAVAVPSAASVAPASAGASPRRRGRSSAPAPRR
jgi:predicted PurR-regulated permease PerM